MWHSGVLTKFDQFGVTEQLVELFSSYIQGRSLRVVVSGCTSATYLNETFVPHGSVLGNLLWNSYFNALQSLSVASTKADNCTVCHSYARKKAFNMIEITNRQLGDIMTLGRRRQVKFAAEKSQAKVIACLLKDTRMLQG